MFSPRENVLIDDGTVVGRALAIMDVVAESTEPVRLAELSRATGIPKPTVHRIANDLAERDMLERTAAGYRTGPRLLNHGLHAAFQRGYVTALQPALLELHQRSRGEVAWFGTLIDGDFRHVSMVYGAERAAWVRRCELPTVAALGASVALTASGRLQVAFRPELAEHVRRHGCRPLTRYSIIEPTRLGSLLDESADTGFAYEQEQSVLGCNCAAALVTDRDGAAVGIIGVSSFSSSTDTRALRPSLLVAATALRAELTTDRQHDAPPPAGA